MTCSSSSLLRLPKVGIQTALIDIGNSNATLSSFSAVLDSWKRLPPILDFFDINERDNSSAATNSSSSLTSNFISDFRHNASLLGGLFQDRFVLELFSVGASVCELPRLKQQYDDDDEEEEEDAKKRNKNNKNQKNQSNLLQQRLDRILSNLHCFLTHQCSLIDVAFKVIVEMCKVVENKINFESLQQKARFVSQQLFDHNSDDYCPLRNLLTSLLSVSITILRVKSQILDQKQEEADYNNLNDNNENANESRADQKNNQAASEFTSTTTAGGGAAAASSSSTSSSASDCFSESSSSSSSVDNHSSLLLNQLRLQILSRLHSLGVCARAVAQALLVTFDVVSFLRCRDSGDERGAEEDHHHDDESQPPSSQRVLFEKTESILLEAFDYHQQFQNSFSTNTNSNNNINICNSNNCNYNETKNEKQQWLVDPPHENLHLVIDHVFSPIENVLSSFIRNNNNYNNNYNNNCNIEISSLLQFSAPLVGVCKMLMPVVARDGDVWRMRVLVGFVERVSACCQKNLRQREQEEIQIQEQEQEGEEGTHQTRMYTQQEVDQIVGDVHRQVRVNETMLKSVLAETTARNEQLSLLVKK